MFCKIDIAFGWHIFGVYIMLVMFSIFREHILHDTDCIVAFTLSESHFSTFDSILRYD